MRPDHLPVLAGLLWAQWSGADRIEAIQRRRLRRMLDHAHANVPYYRALFERAGCRPADIRSAADLAALPVTTKAMLQEVPLVDRVAAGTDVARCRRPLTSGTTGVPLDLCYSREDWTRLSLGVVRALTAMGARPWDRIASFVGRKDAARRRSWYEHLGVWRGRDVSSWSLPGEWIADLERWRPDVLVGYVVTLRLLAEAVRDTKPGSIRPRLVVSGSGVLDAGTRELMRGVFGCEVADLYGAFEGGAMAWECRCCRGYHLASDIVVLETLHDGAPAAPGGEGEVVITNLQSFTMPIIRYRLDDVAVRSARSPVCGRGLPLLDRVLGRTDDWITMPSGRRVPSQPFYYSIEPAPGIRRWRVVQESVTVLSVEIEPGPEFGADSESLIRRNLAAVIEDGVAVEITLVPELVVHPQMKFRQVSSRVTRDVGRPGRPDR